MSTITLEIPPTTSYRAPGILRRQLRVELGRMGDLIAQSDLRDAMTEQIRLWQNNFIDALNRTEDEESVYEAYVTLLQQLLCDPITKAPLDIYAVLGSDGHTYGSMSLAVYSLAMPEEYRNRSPLDPQNPARFVTTPHPVVRHLTRWLSSHNALFYSPELEKAYLELIPPRRSNDVRARIARLAAREMEHREREAKQKEADFEELAKRLDVLGRAQDQKFRQLHETLDQTPNPLVSVGAHILSAQEEERLAMADLQRRIQAKMSEKVQPVADRIATFAKESLASIEQISQKNKEAMARVTHMMRDLDEKIDHLKQKNASLKAALSKVDANLERKKHSDLWIEQKICETQIAAHELQKQSFNGFLLAVGVLVASAFATWALTALLQGAAASAAVQPIGKGGLFITKIPIP